ncbi:Cof-type HAD-IIB family hydrolase [Paenibacillus abyssi]|uniref:Hydrolase n=1 Tax=Paenibacillus abyssi TaxID=1340531 RepID=A0A917FZH9_9BACL|nr:Cof-type HAD-IIB family hydrolase [Paenibacillus abyssi]GGG15259.1 hydrolase [Paenibacillus abyssi]
MNFDIIALDLDGTLLNESHQLTPGTREAVREAAQRGAEIVLCTGRGPAQTIPILEELGLAGTIITHNGAATVDAGTKEVIHQFTIDPDKLKPFVEYCLYHGVHYDVSTAFELYIETITEEAEKMYGYFQATPIWRKPGTELPPDLVKFTLFGSIEAMDAVQRDWESWSADLKWIRSGELFIDVQHPHANKGQALEKLALIRGVEPGRIMAIGNYYNDIGMLTYAGLGIAMDNSPDEVKAAAKAVTLSNEEEGVRKALLDYAW